MKPIGRRRRKQATRLELRQYRVVGVVESVANGPGNPGTTQPVKRRRVSQEGAFWVIVIALVVAMLPIGAAALTPTATTLVSFPNPSTFGQAVTLTATVSPASATGKVTFYDGVTVLGTGTLSGGQATLITNLLPSGSRSLKAYYAGDATFAAGVSATVAQTVVALPQNGFLTAVNYGAGDNPSSVAVGDFNGDSKADLAVANQYGNNVSVLLGNGDGTFQAAVNYNAGSFPVSVAVGDFNGMGRRTWRWPTASATM